MTHKEQMPKSQTILYCMRPYSVWHTHNINNRLLYKGRFDLFSNVWNNKTYFESGPYTNHRIRSENLMNRKIIVNKTCGKLSERKLKLKSENMKLSIFKFRPLTGTKIENCFT